MEATDPRWYAFRDTVYARQYEEAQAQLGDSKELLFLVNPLGETVLHFLAIEDDLASVKWLFARGADLNTKNAFGTPLIFEVAQLASENLFGWLVEHGADPNATGGDGEDIVEYLEKFEHDDRIAWVRAYVA